MDFDLFSFFGVEEKKEEPKEEPKAVETEVVSDADLDDAVTEEVTEDEDSEETTSSKPSPKKAAKKSSSITGKTKVSLPLTVYGRNFSKTYASLEDATYNGLVKALYDDGYKEAAVNGTEMFLVEGGILLKTPDTSTQDNYLLTFPENGEIVVADGLLQAPITQAVIGKDADECCVADLAEKFSEVNPSYADCNINYDAKVAVAVPVFEGKVDEISVPATVTLFGNKIEISETDYAFGKIKAADVVKLYAPFDTKGAEFTFGSLADGSYVVLFKKGKAPYVQMLDKISLQSLKDAPVKEIEEKYALPFLCVATSSDQRFTATSEMFSGKAKVTQKEVLELLSKSRTDLDPALIGFKIYASSDRQFTFVYGGEGDSRKLVVSAVSGKKG